MTSHTSVSASASTVHATPDPSTWENLWWSSRPVPKRHTHLRSGEPVALALYKTVIAGIHDAVKELKPGHPYKGGGHRYYVIPPAPPAPYDHGFFRDRHQQPQI